MPALALKVLRVLLEYGALLWLAYVVVRLGHVMFSSLHTDLREAAICRSGFLCRNRWRGTDRAALSRGA